MNKIVGFFYESETAKSMGRLMSLVLPCGALICLLVAIILQACHVHEMSWALGATIAGIALIGWLFYMSTKKFDGLELDARIGDKEVKINTKKGE